MSRTVLITFLSAAGFFLLAGQALNAQDQQQKEIDVMELAEKEADRLQQLLNLDDAQVFYVDSTLKHDYPAMKDELDAMSRARVSNPDVYVSVQDKWMERIDASYKRIFNPEQWAVYQKNGGAKQQKARDKRKAKAEGRKQ
ncbi:MAG: hypothetical protein ACI395_10085 [Candidatus Cryptobacteroides sp.]